MNTNQVKKLTLVSYSCDGKLFSYFVMAQYDEKDHASINPGFLTDQMQKNKQSGKCIHRGNYF